MVSARQPRRAQGGTLLWDAPSSKRQRKHRLGFGHACTKWETGTPARRPEQSLLRRANDFFDASTREDARGRATGKVSFLSGSFYVFRASFRDDRCGREAAGQKSWRTRDPNDYFLRAARGESGLPRRRSTQR